MFLTYTVSGMGFIYCCPVLGLDRVHLKLRYRGCYSLAPVLMQIVYCFLWPISLLMLKMTIIRYSLSNCSILQFSIMFQCIQYTVNLCLSLTTKKAFSKLPNMYSLVVLIDIAVDTFMTTFINSSKTHYLKSSSTKLYILSGQKPSTTKLIKCMPLTLLMSTGCCLIQAQNIKLSSTSLAIIITSYITLNITESLNY